MVDMARPVMERAPAAEVDTEDEDVGTSGPQVSRASVTSIESVEPLDTNAEPKQWACVHPGARRNSRRTRQRTSPGIKLADNKTPPKPVSGGGVKKSSKSGRGGSTSPSALAAGGVKKHLMQRWVTTEDGSSKSRSGGKRRRPKLVHYMESGDPVPARYAPGSRLGNLIETELNTVRGMGAARVNVKMNLRGRAKLESFFLSATGVVRAACRIAVPRLVGTAKVLGRDANTIRDALAELNNKQLRYLDALQDRLRTRSSTALWSVIVGNQEDARDTRDGRTEPNLTAVTSRMGDGQPAYAPRLQAPE